MKLGTNGAQGVLNGQCVRRWLAVLPIAPMVLGLIASCTSSPTAASTPASITPTNRPAAPRASASATPTATPTAASTATPTLTTTPSAIAAAIAVGTAAPALPATLITRTAHLDLYRSDGGLAATSLLELAPRFEEAIRRVGARLGARLAGRVAIDFAPPQTGPCALRGLTRSHERIIQLYYAPETPARIVLPIVAHELAHELQHDYYGWDAHRRSDTILLEGQATWASSDYARGDDGRPAWASEAEQALAGGNLLPLPTDLEHDCQRTTRNAAYTGWASFVDFLIASYGRERFDTAYRSGRGHTPGTADYKRVYGSDLDALDREWRKWLADRAAR